MKILLTGAKGQLGQELQASVPSQIQLIPLSHAELDISRAATVSAAVSKIKPDWIVNTAAYNAVDKAEAEPEQAYHVNVLAPRHLAQAALENQSRLLHVSTDYVFDGTQNTPYLPEDHCNPLNVYGKTKWQGEQEIQKIMQDFIIVRTSWLYSIYAKNFVKSMLQLLNQRDTLEVVVNQIGSPTWSHTLAQTIWRAVTVPNVQGIYHCADAGAISRYDFTLAIQEEALSLKLLSNQATIKPILAENFVTPAKRPAYSALNCDKTWRDFNLEPTPWRTALKMMLNALITQNSPFNLADLSL